MLSSTRLDGQFEPSESWNLIRRRLSAKPTVTRDPTSFTVLGILGVLPLIRPRLCNFHLFQDSRTLVSTQYSRRVALFGRVSLSATSLLSWPLQMKIPRFLLDLSRAEPSDLELMKRSIGLVYREDSEETYNYYRVKVSNGPGRGRRSLRA